MDVKQERRERIGVKALIAQKGLRSVKSGVARGAVAFALGCCRLPFGAGGLGVAYLCAAERGVPYILAGLLLSGFLGAHPYATGSIYLGVTLLRVLARLVLDPPKKEGGSSLSFFGEQTALRMAIAAVGALLLGLLPWASGGFLYYDLAGMLLGVATSLVALPLFTRSIGERVSESSWLFLVSRGLVAFFALYGIREMTLLGISPAVLVAMMVTLHESRKRGIVAGMGAGLVCGLAIGPLFLPSFVLGAVSAIVLFRFSVFLASMSACLVGVSWGVYAIGLSSLGQLLPALLGAGLLFPLWDKLMIGKEEAPTVQETSSTEEDSVREHISSAAFVNEIRLGAVKERTEALCRAFRSLSDYFSGVGEQMRTPSRGDLMEICESVFDSSCIGCPQYEICWGEESADTRAAQAAISAVLHAKGSVSIADTLPSLQERCGRLSDIADELNYRVAEHRRALSDCDKNEIFALDYASVAELLEETVREEEKERGAQEATAREVGDALFRNCGIPCAVAFTPDGGGTIRLRSAHASGALPSAEEAREVVERICRIPYRLVCATEEEIVLCAAERFSVSIAQKSLGASEEDCCGDTVSVFEGRDGHLFALLSDGMGSGREAERTSRICALFLERMLAVTHRCDVALRMLNGFLRHKGSGSLHECSATVDLLEIDRVAGKASFYKSGAAPTYVLRGGNLFKIRSKTVPLGILREIDVKRIRFDLDAEDVIVMVSDGVTRGREECPWLFALLEESLGTEPPERTADRILERASLEGNDDASVILIRVEGKKDEKTRRKEV